MKKHVLRVGSLLLTVVWMLLIFGFSAQSGEESGGLSAMIAAPVTNLLASISEAMSFEEKAALYLRVDGIVRTAAHFCEYTILGGLLMLLCCCIKIRRIWLPWIVGTLYALTDEWHQSFSPGRVCDMRDVFVDACGVICGIVLCNILIHIWRKKHVRNS